MKTTIPVENRREGEQIRRALENKEVRAFVRITGTLLPLSSDRARARVLNFVWDRIREEREARVE